MERIEALMKYIPQPDELEAVKSYEGEVSLLGPSEQYFRAILPIPNYEAKLDAMMFKQQVLKQSFAYNISHLIILIDSVF
jgi:hypothetical protein